MILRLVKYDFTFTINISIGELFKVMVVSTVERLFDVGD